MFLTDKQMRCAVASAFFVLLFLGAPATAHALSCKTRDFTLKEAFDAADSIIVGLITECEDERSSDSWTNGGDDCTFSNLEVLKESISTRDYGGVTSSSGCGLSLHVGSQYLLFLDSENQPLRPSAPLSGDQYPVQLANHHLRIIREFRDGAVNDLADPWILGELDGTCSLSHDVAGHQISFSRRKADAPLQPRPTWSQETENGKTVYRSKVPVLSGSPTVPVGDVEIVALGQVPDYPDDSLVLKVRLADESPAPVRQTSLSVGGRTWSLHRLEMNLSFAGPTTYLVVDYYVAGDVAEQILSAIRQPSDILVSAALVAPGNDRNPPRATIEPSQSTAVLVPANDDYLGPELPKTSPAAPAVTPSVRAAAAYGAQVKPPQPVLRLESRSTQLSREIPDFQTCYGGDNH